MYNISRHNVPKSKHSLQFDRPADDLVNFAVGYFSMHPYYEKQPFRTMLHAISTFAVHYNQHLFVFFTVKLITTLITWRFGTELLKFHLLFENILLLISFQLRLSDCVIWYTPDKTP